MKLYNLKERSQLVDFDAAVKMGLGRGQGLFFPETLPQLPNVGALLNMQAASVDIRTKRRMNSGWGCGRRSRRPRLPATMLWGVRMR